MEKTNISVLYVEDEAPIREIHHRVLSSMVETIYTACDGEDGLQKFIEHEPDLTITDIKMPKMNGFDMIKKIKEHKKNAKTVIISAYNDNGFMLRAVDEGVQGFLTKPITTDKLKKLIQEQSREIILEKEIKFTEEELKRREAILQSVSFAAETFLNTNYSRRTLPAVLESLGKATEVSRVYVFEKIINTSSSSNKQELDNDSQHEYFKQIDEWCAEGIKSEIDNPLLQHLPTTYPQVNRIAKILANNQVINSSVKELPMIERDFFADQAIKSIVIVPVFVNNSYWGFFGLDDCTSDRVWTDSEVQALRTAANIFGAAIYRKQTSQELEQLNENLELKVMERTEDLKKEIMERQEIEQNLRESEEKYRLIIENANDGIMLTIDGYMRFMNPKLYEMTGFFPREIIQKPFVTLVDEEFKDTVRKSLVKAEKYENSESIDIQLTSNKGEKRWFEMKSAMIDWEHRKAVLSILTDITERKLSDQHLKKRLKEESEKLKEQMKLFYQKNKLETLGELAAGMAHEIRQPLSTLRSGLENMQFKLTSPKPVDETYLDKKFKGFDDDIERINDQIENIRKFSRDQKYDKKDPFDVSKAIQSALDSVSPRFIDNKINIENKNELDSYVSYGKQTNLQQVITNVLINAKQAVNKKETITKDSDYQKRIDILSCNKDNKIIITIKDNGIGIPKDIMNNIFDPYFTTKDVDEGTGMGLSISYGLVTDMNGIISVNSEEGEFTEIKIILPIHIEE